MTPAKADEALEMVSVCAPRVTWLPATPARLPMVPPAVVPEMSNVAEAFIRLTTPPTLGVATVRKDRVPPEMFASPVMVPPLLMVVPADCVSVPFIVALLLNVPLFDTSPFNVASLLKVAVLMTDDVRVPLLTSEPPVTVVVVKLLIPDKVRTPPVTAMPVPVMLLVIRFVPPELTMFGPLPLKFTAAPLT